MWMEGWGCISTEVFFFCFLFGNILLNHLNTYDFEIYFLKILMKKSDHSHENLMHVFYLKHHM